MDLSASFKQHWTNERFAQQGQHILLAISGGMDSMVLAHLFLVAGIEFGMGHCNFGLRGEESDGDEAFVRSWAEQHDFKFHVTHFDTLAASSEQRTGIQETARELRYAWLEQVRQEHNYAFIATAHHADDNVETLLINLFKGTGIAGLHGIRKKNGKLIRPLLFASREEIKEYASVNNIQFREDSSNSSDKYLRNAVRLNILPVIQQYFPEAKQRINESIVRFAQVEQLYKKETERQIKKLKDQRGKDIYIPVLKFLKTEQIETVCYELFKPYGFSAAQVSQLIDLAGSPSGKLVENEHYQVIKDRDFLIITKKEVAATEFLLIESVPSKVDTGTHQFSFSSMQLGVVIPDAPSIATVDATDISFPLILRKWKTGDYFYPLGMGMKKKKLSRFFIDQKIPVHEKEKIWVLESNKRIVWVAGMRIDERFKVRPTSSSLLKIEMRPVRNGDASAG